MSTAVEGFNRASGTSPSVVLLDGSTRYPVSLLGGKAWGINEMQAHGLPIPPAFAATTQTCRDYFAHGRRLDETLWGEIVTGVRWLEARTGRRFGATHRPLLVSVRSGAADSMPGMMDTCLNLGINNEVEQSLARESGDASYASDVHRRFLAQFREVVTDVAADDVPDDPWAQLRHAVQAVFESWLSPRAIAYRANRGLDTTAGTAVTVQAMVFGNLDELSGTGVLFSRNPLTGENQPYGEWLPQAQGEDVVSGRCDPLPLANLAERQPKIHAELLQHARTLEEQRRDMQDIEFTIESGRLWILQCRSAKRSARGAVRAAVAMATENMIPREEAVRRVTPDQVRTLLKPSLETGPAGAPAHRGEPACPGIATGVVVLDPDEAEERGEAGEDVILARATTSPADLHGMLAARAVVTELGGATSHAAVVSREINRPCVVGCGADTVTGLAGQVVTIDGDRGEIWLGRLGLTEPDEATIADFAQLFSWASELVPIRVLRPHQAPADSVEVSLENPRWRDLIRSSAHVHGTALATDEALRLALEHGVQSVTVPQALPVLLTLAGLTSGTSDRRQADA
jgi:pyruvate,orthophosphate dikinase